MLLLLRDSLADITSDTIEGYPTGEGRTFEISNHLFSKLIYGLKQCGLRQRRQKRRSMRGPDTTVPEFEV